MPKQIPGDSGFEVGHGAQRAKFTAGVGAAMASKRCERHRRSKRRYSGMHSIAHENRWQSRAKGQRTAVSSPSSSVLLLGVAR